MTTEIVPVNRIEQALRKENITEQVIAKLRADYLCLKVKGEDDKEGYEIIRKARLECKNLRVLAQKIAKAGREDAIAEQKAWIAAEKNVTGQISEVEIYLEGQEKIVSEAEDRRKAAEAEATKKAAEEAERKAREKTQNRINSLLKFGVSITWEEASTMVDSDFAVALSSAETVHKAVVEKKRIEDERRAEEDKKRREEQEKIDAERKKLDEEKRRIEIENAKREADEKARREERERIDREKKEAEEKAKREAEEKARLEALKPDKEKLANYAECLDGMLRPTVTTPEANLVLKQALKFVDSARDLLRNFNEK